MAGNQQDERDAHEVSEVIDFAAARASRRKRDASKLPDPIVDYTLLVRASVKVAGEEIIRHLGVDESLTLGELGTVLAISFGFTGEAAPSLFEAGNLELSPQDTIGDLLRGEHDQLTFHWGLWEIAVVLGDRWFRDEGTPRALCVGGIGEFHGAEFNLSKINEQLTEDGVAEQILAQTRPEVRGLIERSGIFDFIPLLQAMDLEREVELPADTIAALRSLPLEFTRQAIDAFWATVLALSCLATDNLTDRVLEELMSALDWGGAEGDELSAAQIREMCADSLAVLAQIGAYGEGALAPVDRLDIYRELIRRLDL